MEVHEVHLPGQTIRVESPTLWFDMLTTCFHTAPEADFGFPQEHMGNFNFGFFGRHPRPGLLLLQVFLPHAAVGSSSNGMWL